MKKSLFAAVFAALCFSVWAQVPQTIKPDYHRSAMHYLDGDKHFVNSDVFLIRRIRKPDLTLLSSPWMNRLL